MSAVLASASLLALAVPQMAWAADPAPPAPAPEPVAGSGEQIADIVVVGEKRAVNLQSAPLAISAISADALRERNVVDVADLNGFVPGLTVSKSEGNERVIAIRGIGYETAQNPNSQPGVAFHIDGVYIAHVVALNQDLLDVDHVEVLRGPQGTVFGQTSTGGAINVITRKPVFDRYTGEASVSYGNYNYVRTEGTLNVPLAQNLAIRGTVQYLRHDGYGYATQVPGYSKFGLDDADDLGAHVTLLWQPEPDFSVELSGQSFDAWRHAALQKCTLCSTDPLGGSLTYISDPNPDPRAVTQDYGGLYKTKTRMAYLTVSKTIADKVIAKSVSAYQYLDKNQTGDNDRYAYANYYDNLVRWRDYSSTYSEELSFASTPNKHFEWVVGAFWLRQNALQDILEYSSNGFATDPSNGQATNFQTNSPYQHTTWAGYGQGIWHATPKLDLIAGARYNWDRVTAQPVQYFAVVPPRATESAAVTGKVSVQYQIDPSHMVYVTGSKGYKPTGVTFAADSLWVKSAYKKETVWAAEIGTKNDFFGKKLRLNVAGYYYWYDDYQFTAEDPIPYGGGTANIPKAEIYGLEFEGMWAATRHLKFDGTLALADGKFKGDYYAIDRQTAQDVRATTYASLGYPAAWYYDSRVIAAVEAAAQNTNGHKIPKLPGVQGNIAATYTTDLGPGQLTFRGEVVYRGKFNSRIFNVAQYDTIPSYTLGNLYIEYKPNNSMFTFSFTATNVTDTLGVSNKFADPYGSGTTSVEYIPPRQVFGTVKMKF
ncbi:TonB-dependent receptor [Novosphingobium nitrogenifigens DSM 19370]|uniref:TonB-dependent receptor n=2 Tax=Novosphingobium nitrogenifigens TaxID=378548 RepID=F1Z3J8_9SPHN|nr:TonB-dependent receptor [Novosphingobium nitrogenifigens DSM 19370]